MEAYILMIAAANKPEKAPAREVAVNRKATLQAVASASPLGRKGKKGIPDLEIMSTVPRQRMSTSYESWMGESLPIEGGEV